MIGGAVLAPGMANADDVGKGIVSFQRRNRQAHRRALGDLETFVGFQDAVRVGSFNNEGHRSCSGTRKAVINVTDRRQKGKLDDNAAGWGWFVDRTPEQLAEDGGVPLEAVQEAIEYCASDPPALRQDKRKTDLLREAIGMNDPAIMYTGKPRSLSTEERVRLET